MWRYFVGSTPPTAGIDEERFVLNCCAFAAEVNFHLAVLPPVTPLTTY